MKSCPALYKIIYFLRKVKNYGNGKDFLMIYTSIILRRNNLIILYLIFSPFLLSTV